MKKHLFLICILFGRLAHAQNGLFNNLPVGQYAVGFKIVTLTDASRVKGKLYNYFGERDTSDRRWKINVHIWYPAVANTGKGVLTYGDYCYNSRLKSTMEVLPQKDKEALLDNARRGLQNFFGNITDDDWKKLMATNLLAQKDAVPLKGKFPLLVGMLRPVSTSISNEMMASNGYIVAMVSHANIEYPVGYIPEMQNMQEAIEYIGKNWIIDENNIGTYGFSGSGFTQVLLAMQDPRIAALADIESGLYMNELWQQISSSNYYNGRKLVVPFLHLFSKDLTKEEKFINEFEKIKFADRYRVILNQPQMHHWDFASEGRASVTVLHLRGDKEAGIRNSFEIANLYLLHFFNMTLKNDSASQRIIAARKSFNYPDTACTVIHYPAIKPPPDRESFTALIDKKGIDEALLLAKQVYAVDTGAEILQPNAMNWVSHDLQNKNKLNESILLMKYAVEIHPSEAWLWNNLSSVEEDAGKKEESILSAEKVLELLKDVNGTDPGFNDRVKKSATDRINRLKKL